MLTDQEIKQHEIRLTAQNILAAEEERSLKKKRRFSWPIFLGIVSPLALATAVAVPFIVKSTRPATSSLPSVDTFITITEGKRISSAVVSSLSLLRTSSRVQSRRMELERVISYEGFKTIVNVYDQADDLLALQYNGLGESYHQAENVDYKGIYGRYPYKIAIDGSESIAYYFTYSKEGSSVHFTGESVYAGTTYRIEGENKVEGNESEYHYRAYLDEANYLSIEEEKEVDEYAYEYTLVENGAERYALHYEQDEEVSLSFVIGATTYDYQINHTASIWSIAYQTESVEGTMTLERKTNEKIYTDEETAIQISKTFQ